MINENIISGIENISSVRKAHKPSDAIQKSFARTKANALGDLGNTLHSRLNNKAQSAKKPLLDKKEFFTPKPNCSEVIKNSSSKLKSTVKNQAIHDVDDFHDHFLCEHADDEATEKYLSSYLLTEEQINNTIHAFRRFNFPAIVTVPKLSLHDTTPVSHLPKPKMKRDDSSFDEFMMLNEPLNVPPPEDFIM